MMPVSDEGDQSRRGAIFRFAPSPNGLLHAGHAYSALYNARAASRAGGRFLLRIEDIDRERARAQFEAAILEDLAWLGLSWETPVLRQSDRIAAYADALADLDRLGLLYPAFLSRAEIRAAVEERESAAPWPRDPDGAPLYPGTERDWSQARRRAGIESGRPHALRLDMRRALEGVPPLHWSESDPLGSGQIGRRIADPGAWGDVILARCDAPASYHVAVVVDDAHQGITHVVRGADLLHATSVHRLLQHLFDLPVPLYFHHGLIHDEAGAKLAKSRNSASLRARRARDPDPTPLIRELGF